MVEKSENVKKFNFFFFFFDYFFLPKKILYFYFSNIRRTGYNQRSPVQPVSKSRGVSTSVTEEEEDEGQRTKEIHVFNLGFLASFLRLRYKIFFFGFWSTCQAIICCTTYCKYIFFFKIYI